MFRLWSRPFIVRSSPSTACLHQGLHRAPAPRFPHQLTGLYMSSLLRCALWAPDPIISLLRRSANVTQKDLGEYSQCQTMLRQLYELGIKGHPQEFLSYRIIYLLHTRNRSGEHIICTRNQKCLHSLAPDMAALLAQLTPAEKSDPGVHHALQVHASLATSNYVRFFRLFNSAPNMSGYIMDHFVGRERMSALAVMTKRCAFLDNSGCALTYIFLAVLRLITISMLAPQLYDPPPDASNPNPRIRFPRRHRRFPRSIQRKYIHQRHRSSTTTFDKRLAAYQAATHYTAT